MDRFKNIVVPIDGSKTSFECLRIACHLAVQNLSTIHLLHVINTNTIKRVEGYSPSLRLNFNELVEQAEHDGNNMLKTFVTDIKKETSLQFNFMTKIIKGENVDEEIINYTNDKNGDLIVVGKASKRHAWNVVVGHVAMRLVEFSNVPVLTIPTQRGDEA